MTLGKQGGPPLKGRVRYVLLDGEGSLSASGSGKPPLVLRGLKPGDYELFAVSPGAGVGGRGPVRVTAPDRGTPARGTLHLEPWATTTGIVRNPEGAPIPGLMVIAEMADWPTALVFECARTMTDDSGRFQLRIPTGSPQLVRAQDGSRVLSSATS